MKKRALLAGLTAAATVVALSGCTLANAITPPVEAQLYSTLADASGAPSSLAVPSWVPADATNIRIKTNTETGDSLMQFYAAPVSLGGPCDASVASNLPKLDDTWWPQTLPTDGIVCADGWHLFLVNNAQYNAWKP